MNLLVVGSKVFKVFASSSHESMGILFRSCDLANSRFKLKEHVAGVVARKSVANASIQPPSREGGMGLI